MKLRLAAPLLLGCLAVPALGAGPYFDPFVESFAVGAYRDPAGIELVDGWPAGLWRSAQPDTAWRRAAAQVLAAGGRRHVALLTAAGTALDADAWRRAVQADIADPWQPGPVTRDLAPVTRFFGALAAGDTVAAVAVARELEARRDLSGAERVVWSLRATGLTAATDPAWAAADTLLAELGPWDAANTWALAVALRRQRGQAIIPPDSDDEHGKILAGLSRSWLTPADLAAAPYGGDVKAALGAVALDGAELRAHLAAYPDPPEKASLQGLWIRGQRRASRGDAARYEELAARGDLQPRWRVDLWRRASERRLLAGAWPEGIADLDRALALARTGQVEGGLRRLLHTWAEQAAVLALAQERLTEADAVLALIEDHLQQAPDAEFAARIAPWQVRLAGTAPGTPAGTDRVDGARTVVRRGEAAVAVPATTDDRLALVTTDLALWDTWLAWGLALTGQEGIPADRRQAAAAYRQALERARIAGSDEACLAAALDRLLEHEDTFATLLAAAFAADVRDRTGGSSPPRPSPLPRLAVRHRGSQADLHALLGVAVYVEDMRGTLAAATFLPGTGLSRDQKRLFLYPLPGPGSLRDAVLAAGNEPALLLAIARNESLFEPAARSRAGALGWMQVMPFHHDQRGALPGSRHWSQPAAAVARGDALVTENRRRYDGDPYRLLAAYNAGPGAADRWDSQLGGGADRATFLAWIGYPETRNYVEKVLIDRDMYVWILDGAGSAPAPSQPDKE